MIRPARAATFLALLLASDGCTKEPAGEGNSAAAAPAAGFYTDLPMKQFMHSVVQFAADNVWSRQGWETDDEGEHSKFPKNDAEWDQAKSASLTLADITNLLELPGRKRDDGQWVTTSREVRRVALELAAAADKKDENAFFEAGGKLYSTCESCHIAYIPAGTPQPAIVTETPPSDNSN